MEALCGYVVLSGFQYPLSDRAHCNWHMLLDSWMKQHVFQYPLSDRAHCNCDHRRLGARLYAFSILCRIEPTVTADVPSVTLVRMDFQYPLSDRAHCNPPALRVL